MSGCRGHRPHMSRRRHNSVRIDELLYSAEPLLIDGYQSNVGDESAMSIEGGLGNVRIDSARIAGHSSAISWRGLDSAPNPESEKVMEGCAVIQGLVTS
jgi:hypothetical protein